MVGYVAFYRGKRTEVRAETWWEAKQKAAAELKAENMSEVNLTLFEVDGKQIGWRPTAASAARIQAWCDAVNLGVPSKDAFAMAKRPKGDE